MALIATLKAYERHLSALAMVVGFAVDNFAFGRVDHPATQIVLAAYLLIAAVSIVLLHYFEERAQKRGEEFRWAGVLSAFTQFAFGGLWSAFLIFYSRSAVMATSWPFLVILAAILLGNEIFRDYRSRLVFTAILFFFALFSYATFVVPIFAGRLDSMTFVASGALAMLLFAVFLAALALLARSRFSQDLGQIVAGAVFIFISLNTLYYMDVLPPLPLALADAGIFASKDEVARKYRSEAAFLPWYKRFSDPRQYQMPAGAPLYAFSSVFAPDGLTTQIVHEWEWYDEAKAKWVTETVIPFAITGGRANGYRGYSTKANLRNGLWRVDVETRDGRVISRVNFAVGAGYRAAQH
jgi:MFS family permease